MRKFLILGVLAVTFSCSKKVESNAESNVMLEEPAVVAVDSAAAGKHEGLALIEGADCLTCHKVDSKVAGLLIRKLRTNIPMQTSICLPQKSLKAVKEIGAKSQ